MLPCQHFCQGVLGQKFQFFVKNSIFLLQNVFITDFFWLEFEISASELTPVPNFSSIEQKIRELHLWPGTIPKTAWWRHTYLLVMTSAKFLWLWEILSQITIMPSLVLIGQQITEKQRGCPPPEYVVPNNPSLNRVNSIWHGAMMTPQNVFDHCAQTLRRRKLKLGDF